MKIHCDRFRRVLLILLSMPFLDCRVGARVREATDTAGSGPGACEFTFG